MNALEICIVWCHAVVLQSRNGLHTLLRHILLCEGYRHLLGTVVTEVDEDNNVAFFDTTIDANIMDRLDEFVSYALIVAFLHGLNHISSLLTSAVHNQVVTLLYTLPTLVAIHCIETTYDRGDSSIILSTNL